MDLVKRWAARRADSPRPVIRVKCTYIRKDCRIQPSSAFVDTASTAQATQLFPGANVLFVDGEGTLRRTPDGESPEGLGALQEALRRPKLAKLIVVACGQWKEVLSFDRLIALFDEDISHRIVGRTPDLHDDGTGLKNHREVLTWLAAHPEIADYCFLGPFYGLEPHLESAIFISDGYVFGEDSEDVSQLEKVFDPAAADLKCDKATSLFRIFPPNGRVETRTIKVT